MYDTAGVFDLSVIDLGTITNTSTEIDVDNLTRISRLTVLKKEDRAITEGGLERSTPERLHSQLQNKVETILNDKVMNV